MRRHGFATALVVWLAALPAFSAVAAVFEVEHPTPSYPSERHLLYRLGVTNESDRVVPSGDLRVYAPVRQTAHQRCLRIETSHPSELIADDLGNQVLRFPFHGLAPRETRIVSIRVDLGLSDVPNSVPHEDRFNFLGSELHIESDHPEIARLARSLEGGGPLATAHRVFDWVAENLRYAGYLKEDRGALYALRRRKGDCTEYASLFVALCRAGGLRARRVDGYEVSESAILRPSEYHSWAEFWDGNVWQTSDPLRGVFASGGPDRVAFRISDGAGSEPEEAMHRFRTSPEALSAVMLPP